MSKKKKRKNREDVKSVSKKNVFLNDDSSFYDTNDIRKKWGNDRVNESNKNWNNMTKDEQRAVLQECSDIFTELSDYIGEDPNKKEVVELMIRWHKFIKNFYDPSIEVLRGLGLMYVYDTEFLKKFEQIDPELPDFLGKAINCYVDMLEEKWLESNCNILEH